MTKVDYQPGFTKSKTFYENEFPPNSKKPWPYEPPTLELAWNEAMKQVVDPSSKEYYKGTNGETPKETITQIVRVRVGDGEEYLYSIGSVRFYNMYGDPVDVDRRSPETYEKPIFHHITQPNADGHNVRVTDSIEEKIAQYDLPFNAENVDILLKKKSQKGCMLTVKDENSGRVKECKDIEMFKTKPIDHILNDEWQSPEQREVILKEHELSQGKKR